MDEADQEIEYMLNILGDYRLDMPIILDWEIPASDARTANMDARTLTDIQLYFCEKMKGLGYQPMVYFNWHQSENLYYLSELEDFPFWLALYQDRCATHGRWKCGSTPARAESPASMGTWISTFICREPQFVEKNRMKS